MPCHSSFNYHCIEIPFSAGVSKSMPYTGSKQIGLLAVLPIAYSQCYFPSGSSPQESGWQPCSSDTSNPLHTVCCFQADHCLPNGMCLSGDGKVYGRSLCTEQTWTQDACLGVCMQSVRPWSFSSSSNIKTTFCRLSMLK